MDVSILFICWRFVIVHISKKNHFKKIKIFFNNIFDTISFFSNTLFLFIFSPFTYAYISITQTDKRTDYPGKKIARAVENEWENNFIENIGWVGGNEWQGGNLSYHLKSRPRWDNLLDSKKTISLKNIEGGFLIIGDNETLSKICKGIFFEVEGEGICMIGKKK